MDGNPEQPGGHSWPIGIENVQIQYADGLQLPTSTISDAQLQQLTQAGYSFTVYNDSGDHTMQQNVVQPQSEIDTSQIPDYESSIQDSLQHLQGLQSKQVSLQPKEKKEEMVTDSKVDLNVSSTSTPFPTTNSQPTVSGVILNADGLRHEFPITFNIDGKPYALSDLGVLKLLAGDGGKEIPENAVLQQGIAEPLQQHSAVLQQPIALLQDHNASQQHNLQSLHQSTVSLQNNALLQGNNLDQLNNASVQHDAELKPQQSFQQFQQNVSAVTPRQDYSSFQHQQDRYNAANAPEIDTQYNTSSIVPSTQENTGLHETHDLLTLAVQRLAHCQGIHTDRSEEPVVDSSCVVERVEPSRKSKRLAKLEQDAKMVPVSYSPQNQPYDVNELWCEECKKTYTDGCILHKVQSVYDKVVLSRAWSSLPPQLAIYKLSNEPDANLGVFAKKAMAKNVQFGPYVGETVSERSELSDDKFVLKIEGEQGSKYIKAMDEDKCNWMMFVRPAENYMEQNLVAFQYGEDIFFTTIKDIEPKEELKVWYAAHYAHRMNVQIHPVPVDSQENSRKEKFECYQCEQSFRTAALLQKHLDQHEGKERVEREIQSIRANSAQDGSESTATEETSKQEGGSFQSWKKRKRNMYLNKIKKYKEISKRAEQKREQRDKSTNEVHTGPFSCKHCDSTFDNASMLNIHTLTHAADFGEAAGGSNVVPKLEMVDFDSLKMLEDDGADKGAEEGTHDKTDDATAEKLPVKCPFCIKRFSTPRELLLHTSTHADHPGKKIKSIGFKRQIDLMRPHGCNLCSKSFTTEDRLIKHQLSHSGDDSHKPLSCEFCEKKFMNNSALACHMKTHSELKYFTCPMCKVGFDQMVELRKHAQEHLVNGLYPCSDCHKSFPDLSTILKHVRAKHPYGQHTCPECRKIFTRADKLRLHMLRHSDHKAFMCEECGHQFKRKDKMKEHIKRMHNPTNPRMVRRYGSPREGAPKKFIPKVAPTEFHRFIYKCQQCLLGFKRRGMLVNHLAKRHPAVKPDSIPELNLPILRTQRDFFCQYCEKVYKSSSKRKAHILKVHPGAPLPPNQRSSGRFTHPNESYSQCVGSITTNPVHCEYCHKQYASRAKMMQHQRKDHPSLVPQKRSRFGGRRTMILSSEPASQVNVINDRILEFPDGSVVTVQTANNQIQDVQVQHADLLTQAMSELTQNLDYRPQQTEFQITLPAINNLTQGTVDPSSDPDRQQETSSIVVTPGDGQATLDLSVLGQALMQGGFTATLVTDQSVANGDPHLNDQTVVHSDQHDINEEVVTDTDNIIVQNMSQTQTITVPLSLASQLISKTWNQASEPHDLK